MRHSKLTENTHTKKSLKQRKRKYQSESAIFGMEFITQCQIYEIITNCYNKENEFTTNVSLEINSVNPSCAI